MCNTSFIRHITFHQGQKWVKGFDEVRGEFEGKETDGPRVQAMRTARDGRKKRGKEIGRRKT